MVKDLEKVETLQLHIIKNEPVYAKDLNAQGPMTVLLKEAIRPNVTQTLENNPVQFMVGLLLSLTWM